MSHEEWTIYRLQTVGKVLEECGMHLEGMALQELTKFVNLDIRVRKRRKEQGMVETMPTCLMKKLANGVKIIRMNLTCCSASFRRKRI